jgi:acylphosphatase
MVTYNLIIRGKVQGVFFRATAKEEATKLKLKGWIRNNFDHTVEAIVTGDDSDVQAFIQWCTKGPPNASVEEVTARQVDLQAFPDFTITR